MKKAERLLSVIVPAYKQEKTIVRDLNQIMRALIPVKYPVEIIVVIDGKDGRTYERIKKFEQDGVRIFELKQHHGKGYAVRFGMRKAKGDYISFIDAGMEIDPHGISLLLEHLEWYEADIIVGSKRHPASLVYYAWDRRILSWGYQWVVRLLFNIKIKDTQPGLKIFKRQVLDEILPCLLVKQYAFDIEMLAVAHRFGFTKIYEAPIKLKHRFGTISNAATLRAIWNMLWDTAAVFYRLKIIRYYDSYHNLNT
jgi:glycosyltransferase involved in cell wall biosynthesis